MRSQILDLKGLLALSRTRLRGFLCHKVDLRQVVLRGKVRARVVPAGAEGLAMALPFELVGAKFVLVLQLYASTIVLTVSHSV